MYLLFDRFPFFLCDHFSVGNVFLVYSLLEKHGPYDFYPLGLID